MLKKIEYEAKNIEDIVLDLADEIKNGWKIHSVGYPNIEMHFCVNPKITAEVILSKEF